MISDLDAGAGNFKDTQRTVNTQNLQGERCLPVCCWRHWISSVVETDMLRAAAACALHAYLTGAMPSKPSGCRRAHEPVCLSALLSLTTPLPVYLNNLPCFFCCRRAHERVCRSALLFLTTPLPVYLENLFCCCAAGELMNLCDNPHSVSVGQEWAAVRPRGRVPLFVTANDLTLLYAVRRGHVCRASNGWSYAHPGRVGQSLAARTGVLARCCAPS